VHPMNHGLNFQRENIRYSLSVGVASCERDVISVSVLSCRHYICECSELQIFSL